MPARSNSAVPLVCRASEEFVGMPEFVVVEPLEPLDPVDDEAVDVLEDVAELDAVDAADVAGLGEGLTGWNVLFPAPNPRFGA